MLFCSGGHAGVGDAQGIHPWMGSRTESASGMSKKDNAWQRPANRGTSVAGMELQRPAKPIGSPLDRVVLAVGIW